MKYLAAALLPACLLPVACQSNTQRVDAPAAEVAGAADSALPAASIAPGTPTSEFTFEEQDARLLANRVRVFLGGTEVRIEAPDPQTWIVSGPEEEVALVRIMAMAFDVPALTPEHVGRVYEIEHRDPRLLANSARGRADWGESWIVIATTAPRWYVMVPRDEVADFEAALDELDQPH